MKELKGSDWGIKVDKSHATKSVPMRGTNYPRESGLNCSPSPSPSRNGNTRQQNSLRRSF